MFTITQIAIIDMVIYEDYDGNYHEIKNRHFGTNVVLEEKTYTKLEAKVK